MSSTSPSAGDPPAPSAAGLSPDDGSSDLPPQDGNKQLNLLRAVGLSFLAFLLMVSYSLARPATESMFLEAHTSSRLPAVWIVVALAVVAAVALYNRLVKGRHLLAMYGGASALAAVLLALLVLGRRVQLPFVHYALYAWKDVYIVVLVEIFYTYANTVFPIQTARWVYGFFGAMGALGGILGNLAVGWVADAFGTVAALWCVFGILVIIGVACVPLARLMGEASHAPVEGRPSLTEAFRVVRKSRYLMLILAVVALVQISITLVDYQFNIFVEHVYPNVDTRTGVIGQVYAVISISTVVLNAMVGPVLRLVGVPATLLFIPFFLGAALAFFAVIPRFLTAAVLKAASKAFDYTIFRAAKEILYIPTSYTEKTQGKSVADMLTYRVAKGGASLLLLGMGWLSLTWLALPVTFVSIGAWLVATIAITKRFRSLVTREEELLKPEKN